MVLAASVAAQGVGPAPVVTVDPVRDPAVDPSAVIREGPGWRYPRAGWIVVHIEGAPYERGYQHGRLLAREIEQYIDALGKNFAPSAGREGWRAARRLADALFLRRIDAELLEEMKGIADGAAAGGARVDGRPVDLIDVVTVNCGIEIDFLDGALAATPHGLEGRDFRDPEQATPQPPVGSHCSAFVATGPATADGQVVVGHITMWTLQQARHFNIWLDLKPERGHRVVMQTYPGGIMSGMDFHMNDAGMVLAETTIDQTDFEPESVPLCSRVRRAIQYGDSIDAMVKILSEGNNGLYSNEWLMADTRRNEIAMFELGTHRSKLWRSSRDEWFGGTPGFYWGCNNAKDLAVRLETVPHVGDRPANLVWRPSDRDRAWLAWYDRFRGKIDAEAGRVAFTTPPLASASSLDAKVSDAAMVSRLEALAVFGPPTGQVWYPKAAEQKQYPDIRPLVPNDWVRLTVEPPPSADSAARKPAVDQAGPPPAPVAVEPTRRPAYRGTLLPEGKDWWLAAAFAEYQPLLARILAAEAKGGDALTEAIGWARFMPTSGYLTAAARLGRDLSLEQIEPQLHDDAWYELGVSKGMLVLDALRERLGSGELAAVLDDYGRAHAGKPADLAAFWAAVAERGGPKPEEARRLWLGAEVDLGSDVDARRRRGRYWTVSRFFHEPEDALIVRGTAGDVAANRAAAERLQQAIRGQWCNVTVPIVADEDLGEAEARGKHLLLVGRPATNRLAARLASSWPVDFGPNSLTLAGATYAHPATAVIVAGPHPWDPARSVVLFAGLGAESTWALAGSVPERAAEAWVGPAGGALRPVFVPIESEPPRDPAVGGGQN
jgi:hypothetical protein